MAQFARPDSDVTNPGTVTGTFADIDESSASDTDYIVCDDNVDATYECGLSNVSDPNDSTGHIVRWRQTEADGGVVNASGGQTVTYDVLLIQGTTTIATCASGSNFTESSWAAGSYTLTAGEANSITDYTDLRIRFVFNCNTGGSPGNRRGGAFSWAELEVPDVSAVNLVVQQADHSHTADNVVITHDYGNLTVAEGSHAHTADNVVITSDYPLTVQEGTHAHTADQPTITTAYSLAVNEGTHAHTADNVDVSINLVIQEASHAHAADNVVITHSYTLSVDEATHAHTADNVTVDYTPVGSTNLVVQEASHGHTSDNVVITHKYTLSVNDGLHGHTADQPTVTAAYSLTVAEGAHAHTADNVVVTTAYSLVVGDGSHAHTADNVVLIANTLLVVADGLHLHTADNVAIIDPSAENLNLLVIEGWYAPIYTALDLYGNEIITVKQQTQNQIQAGKIIEG